MAGPSAHHAEVIRRRNPLSTPIVTHAPLERAHATSSIGAGVLGGASRCRPERLAAQIPVGNFPHTIGEHYPTAWRPDRTSLSPSDGSPPPLDATRPMSSLRRLAACLSALLLLQLTLLGADWWCISNTRSADSAHAATAPRHGSHDASPTRAPGDECDTEHTTADCATMPSCAATLTVPANVVMAVGPAPANEALAEPVSIHSQRAAGPDVPPPRG